MKNRLRAMIIFLLPVILSSCGTAATDSGISTVSGTAVSSGTVAANVTEKTTTAAIEGEWKTAYQSYLNEIYKSSKSTKYYLYYFCKNIDGAGAPELFVIDHAVEDGDQMKVYTYKDDVEEIGSRFLNGTTRLLYSEDPSCPGVFTFDVGGGLERYGYITVQDGKLLELELWNEDYSGFHKDRERIEELSSDKLLISESKKVYKENQDIDKLALKPENVISVDANDNQNMFKSISIRHSVKKTLEKKELKEIGVGQDDEYTRINNNRINGGFLIPYNGGYFYDVESGKGEDSTEVVYQDGRGNITKQKDLSYAFSLYVDQDFIYYYDGKKNELRRTREGKKETVINFQYSYWNPLFFAEDGIYYTDIAQSNKTYICKVCYDGKQKQDLYEIDTDLEQIYIYKDELWFIYNNIEDLESGLGKINLSNDEVTVYKGIHPNGDSSAGGQLSFNNGYVYFNSDDGFKRINIQKDYVEQVFKKKADAVNFAGNSLLFCHNKVLYRMDPAGLKKIKTLEDMDGINGIRVEDGKIYIGTYGGAFYSGISQIDRDGKTIEDIVK